MEKKLVDYCSPVFKFPYQRDGYRYYATFHPEAQVHADGCLNFSGRYFIVALTPNGQFRFHVLRNLGGEWKSPDADANMDPDLIQWCGERIESRMDRY
jgi:hypothetical protein